MHNTLKPQTSTQNPQPSTLNPQPATLSPQPSTFKPEPASLNPQPLLLNIKLVGEQGEIEDGNRALIALAFLSCQREELFGPPLTKVCPLM